MIEMRTLGYHATVQSPESLRSDTRAGGVAQFQGHGGMRTWVHLAVPTPVIVADRRKRLREVRVWYRMAAADSWIDAIHVFDGERLVARQDGLLLSSLAWNDEVFPIIAEPETLWGIGVSLHLVFHRASGNQLGHFRIDVGTASATFA